MKILVLLDPFEGYDFVKDTTHLLMLEGDQRGHEICYGELSQIVLTSEERSPSIPCTRVTPLPSSPYFERHETSSVLLTSFDLLLIRKDPPFDPVYHHATQLLSLLPEEKVILNPPSVLRDFNEKLIILNFPEWIPKTGVSADTTTLQTFHRSVGHTLLKPLDGFAGKGILKIDSPEQIPATKVPWMIQEFLPQIAEGEKRLFFLEDRVLASLIKIPPAGKFLANPDLGGRLAPTGLTPREQELAKELGRFFRQNGIFLAGVDLIAEKLTEINITSPGLLWELNELYGQHFEREIIDALESKIPPSPL